jgi:hypothetical protein
VNIPLTIDLSEVKLGPYDNALPLIQAGVGEHVVQINVCNVPKDQTPVIEQLTKRQQEYKDAYQKKQQEVYEWNEKYNQSQAELREARAASNSSEDRPRPPLPNETLQAMLQLMNSGRNYTEELNQIQVVRLLTGWGLAQAQGFVRTNRPATATATA